MSTSRNSAFIEWLDEELAGRGWSDYQLSRIAGISHSVISRARSGHPPKWEACEAIAGALQTPAELVFRRAGLLTPLPEDDAGLEEWKAVLTRLSERDRFELLLIARLKLKLHGSAIPGSQDQERATRDDGRRAGRVDGRVGSDLPSVE